MKDWLALWLVRLSKLMQSNRQSIDDEGTFYEQFFQEKDCRVYRDDPRIEMRRRVIRDFLVGHVAPGATVVDVGCGLGDVLEAVGPEYRRLGVEMARTSASIANQRLGGQAHLLRGSAGRLPLASGTADVCLCLEVLEHLRDADSAARELFRVVRSGGWLIASVPYTYYWNDYLRLMGHYRHYTREAFQDLLERAGFEVSQYLPNYPEWHQAFTRRYVFAQALHLVTKPIFGQETVYDLRWPWSEESVVDTIRRRLEPLRRRESSKSYEDAETSTFVAARKPASRKLPVSRLGRR